MPRPVEERGLPLVEEDVSIRKHWVEGDRIRVLTFPIEDRVRLRDELAREEVEVRRIAHNRPIDQVPDIINEDGVVIVPVVEERLVVRKQLVLVEEVHLIRRMRREPVERSVTRRRMSVDIRRSR